jgi:hypothetical protein
LLPNPIREYCKHISNALAELIEITHCKHQTTCHKALQGFILLHLYLKASPCTEDFISQCKDPFGDHKQTFHHLNKNCAFCLEGMLLWATPSFWAYTYRLLSSRLLPVLGGSQMPTWFLTSVLDGFFQWELGDTITWENQSKA